MLLRAVEYARPTTIEDALRLLGGNEGARPLAGGQTLLNVMKARAAAPDVLVDLGALRELRGVTRGGDGSLELGPMTTLADLMRSSEVAEARPIVAEVASQVADVQVRNRGTVGGNVCSNDPTNHLPPLMIALGARMTIAAGEREREVPAEEFFLGVYFTAVAPGELLRRVTIPARRGGDGFASVTLGRDGTCIVNAAACLEDGRTRVALGCVSATPVLVAPAGTDERSVRDAVRAADFDPPSDVHASAEYRRHLAEVLALRAVRHASEEG
jgi:carbon-monoxide dehydrogenase medium subunit